MVDGPANHGLALGIDVQNLHQMQVETHPDPKKRKVTIEGVPTVSFPCVEEAPGPFVDQLESLGEASPQLTAMSEIQMVQKGATEPAKLNFEDLLPDHNSLMDAPNQNIVQIPRSHQRPPHEKADKELERLIQVSTFGDQMSVKNSDLVSGPALDMLDGIEREMNDGKSLNTKTVPSW